MLGLERAEHTDPQLLRWSRVLVNEWGNAMPATDILTGRPK